MEMAVIQTILDLMETTRLKFFTVFGVDHQIIWLINVIYLMSFAINARSGVIWRRCV